MGKRKSFCNRQGSYGRHHMPVSNGEKLSVADLSHKKLQLCQEIEKTKQQLRLPRAQIGHYFSNFGKRFRLIHGYRLSDFNIVFQGANGKEYSATCHDIYYPFKITVLVIADSVTKISLLIPHRSPLIEIEAILDKMTEKLCPNSVLLTIQQFIHMAIFRSQVIGQLPFKHFDCVVPNLTSEGMAYDSSTFTISARKGTSEEFILELHWTFKWDDAHQALVHSFFAKRTSENEAVKKFLEQLHLTHCDGNEQVLMRVWNEFIQQVATL